MDGAVRIPVQLDGVALRRGPAQQFRQSGLAVGRDVAVGPVGPDQDFAGTVEMQHAVAETLRQQLRQVLQVRKFAARLRRAQMIGDAQGQLLVAPQLEHGLIVGGIHADAAAVDDAGDAEAVHLAKEFARAVDLLVQGRLRQAIEDLAERVAVADHHAGRLVVAVAFQFAAGSDVGIVVNVQRLHRLRRQQQPVIEMLDVDGIVGRGRGHLGGVGRRFSWNCSSVQPPATTIQEPGFWVFAGLADFFQRLLQAWARRSSSLRCRRSARRGCRGYARRSGRESRCGRRDRSVSPWRRRASSSPPKCRTPAPGHGSIASACWIEKSLSTVRILPLNSTVSAVCAKAAPASSTPQSADITASLLRRPKPA